MLWKIPTLFRYWQSNIDLINKDFQMQIVPDPLVYNLDVEVYTNEIRVLISRLLFLAKKIITLKIDLPAPSQFVRLVHTC